MPHFNRTILIGHLTRDPDAKQTQSGTQIATFGLGVNERVPDGQGGYREQANFFDITFFGKRAEALLKWFHKGDPILIEGRLKQDRWEDRDTGQKRYKVHVIGESWGFVHSKGSNNDSRQEERPQQQDDFIPDDVPF